uniref:Peptidase M13 N-terminal domain-containing protein n=1 Tax=Timema monikensis TaxID=170555 RepID=A0A7R9HQ45_9NEOP|nr:unnamed protein product [Timema monikensis]
MTSPGMPTSVPDLVSRDDMTSPGVPTSIPDLLSRGERTSPGVPTYFPDLVSQDDMTSPGMPTSVPDLLSRDDMTSPGVPTSVPDLLSRDDMTSPGVPTSVPDLLSRGEMTSPGVPTSEDDMTKYGDVCYSKDCKTLASHMLSMMDHSANPCDDFYQYACGGLRLRSRMVEVKPADDVWNRLKAVINDPEESSRASQQLIQFYNSCMTYEDSVNEAQRIQKAKHLLAEMTGNPQESNITQLLVKLLNENKTPLFDVLLDIDGRNSSRFALKLVTPVHRSVFERPVDDCLQCSHVIRQVASSTLS